MILTYRKYLKLKKIGWSDRQIMKMHKISYNEFRDFKKGHKKVLSIWMNIVRIYTFKNV